ncbi:MAG TPA: phosphatase PAP2 family protein [Acidimicrobiales bacterium]|nr:phosphatase PAP2 family protein [Acidimicrobiales bacterium]
MSLSWRAGALIAVVSVVVGLAAGLWGSAGGGAGRRVALVRPHLLEAGVLFGLYAAWQLVLDHTVTSVAGAAAHGRWIWHVERTVRLPSEASVQSVVLGHPVVVQAADRYYVLMHYGGMIACLAWVFIRRPAGYRRCRRLLFLATAATIPLQAVPVAPPRALAGLGVVDTAAVYHQSNYHGSALLHPGQLTAMPSVHVVWALLVATFLVTTGAGRWRFLALLYPATTIVVTVVTGNHYWADAIVAAVIVGLALIAEPPVARILGRAQARAGATSGAVTATGGSTGRGAMVEAASESRIQ